MSVSKLDQLLVLAPNLLEAVARWSRELERPLQPRLLLPTTMVPVELVVGRP